MKPIDIREEAIVFQAVQDSDGVNIVPPEMHDVATQIADEADTEIVSMQGDFREVRFLIVPTLTEEQAEELMEKWL